MCMAWTAAWLLCHWLAQMPAIAIQRFVNEKVPRECGAYLRRLCRGQVYCVVSLLGAGRLMLRWKGPEDLLSDFIWEHELFFSMAAGHWLVSLWEDLRCRSLLSGGLDSKALPGVRDPAGLLWKLFTLHHSMAAVGYMVLLHCRRLSAIGTLGLLFQLPMLLLNRREILRLLGPRQWAERAAETHHWHYVYILFLASRGGWCTKYIKENKKDSNQVLDGCLAVFWLRLLFCLTEVVPLLSTSTHCLGGKSTWPRA